MSTLFGQCLFMGLVVFCFIHHGTPTGSFPENFVKIRLDLAKILRILKLFICMFYGLFVYEFVFFVLIIVGHPQKVPLEILWRSNLIRLTYLGSKTMFICLFVCLLTCIFYFNHLGTPTEIYPENFVKIWLDLAEIFKI